MSPVSRYAIANNGCFDLRKKASKEADASSVVSFTKASARSSGTMATSTTRPSMATGCKKCSVISVGPSAFIPPPAPGSAYGHMERSEPLAGVRRRPNVGPDIDPRADVREALQVAEVVLARQQPDHSLLLESKTFVTSKPYEM